jgi:hypothetical protein
VDDEIADVYAAERAIDSKNTERDGKVHVLHEEVLGESSYPLLSNESCR